MISVFTALFIAMICYGVRIASPGEYNDALSIEQTGHLRGIAAIAIMLHHISQEKFEMGSLGVFSFIGSIVCSLFFFWAGYGLMISAQRKEHYFESFVKKRIGKIVEEYILVVVIYSIIYGFLGILQGRLHVFYKGTLIVDNSWYVITLIILYIGFYLIYKNKQWGTRIQNWFMIGWIVAYIIIFRDVLHWGLWWVNSCFSFFIGIFFAQRKKQIDTYCEHHYKPLIINSLVFFVLIFAVSKTRLAGNQTIIKVIADQVSCCGFCFVISMLCKKIQFGNAVTQYLGNLSFELYLLHGLFINLIIRQGVLSGGMAVLVVIGTTITCSHGFKAFMKCLPKRFGMSH